MNNKLESIVFQNREGLITDKNGHLFLQQFGKIDTSMYDKVYIFKHDLSLNRMGAFLLIRGNTYRYVTLGSGKPIISDVSGLL
jgi:hypothetical protein